MSAWGNGVFDNDDAADWANELSGADDLSILDEALEPAIEADDYIEAPEAAVAIAAAEVVAALNGHPSDELPDDVFDFVERVGLNAGKSLIKRALKALKQVKKNSELRDLWEESGDLDSWLDVISDIEARLI